MSYQAYYFSNYKYESFHLPTVFGIDTNGDIFSSVYFVINGFELIPRLNSHTHSILSATLCGQTWYSDSIYSNIKSTYNDDKHGFSELQKYKIKDSNLVIPLDMESIDNFYFVTFTIVFEFNTVANLDFKILFKTVKVFLYNLLNL